MKEGLPYFKPGVLDNLLIKEQFVGQPGLLLKFLEIVKFLFNLADKYIGIGENFKGG